MQVFGNIKPKNKIAHCICFNVKARLNKKVQSRLVVL